MGVEAVSRKEAAMPSPPACPAHLEGYDSVEQQHAQAAHEPGQVVQQVAALALAHLRVFEHHAQPVQRVPQHHQGEQRVGDPLGRLPQELKVRGVGSEISNRAPVSLDYDCPRVHLPCHTITPRVVLSWPFPVCACPTWALHMNQPIPLQPLSLIHI